MNYAIEETKNVERYVVNLMILVDASITAY